MLRTSERARNIHRAVEIRDAADAVIRVGRNAPHRGICQIADMTNKIPIGSTKHTTGARMARPPVKGQ